MNLICCRTLSTRLKNCARFFIALVFGLCSPCSGLAASADITNLVEQIKAGLDDLNANISTGNGSLQSIDDRLYYLADDVGNSLSLLQEVQAVLGSTAEIHNSQGSIWKNLRDTRDASVSIQSTLQNINGYLTGSDLRGLRATLDKILVAISNQTASSTGTGTNIYNLYPNELAGNPWWHTNSAFVTQSQFYHTAYPSEIPDTADGFSFPQFLSLWGSKLNQPSATAASSLSRGAWYNLWGKDSWTRWFTNHRQPSYTWFDWITDAFRSNLVLQSSLAGYLASNATEDANSINNTLGGFEESLGNLLSNALLHASDSNPWWYTNSDFTVAWAEFNQVYPHSPNQSYGARQPQTFPEAFSEFASWLNSGIEFSQYDDPSSDPLTSWPDNLWKSWGMSKYADLGDLGYLHHLQAYTFYDWLADAMKSNLWLVAGTYADSASNMVSDLEDHGYFIEDTTTNSVPPDSFDPFSSANTSDAEDALEEASDVLSTQIRTFSGMVGTGGDPEIVVIPEFTVGGIHVREYRASLSTSITSVCRSVMSFVWGVMLFAALFGLASADFAFYANLGRTWIRNDTFGGA